MAWRVLTDDMIGQGLVHSLAKPGGNTTGVSIFATELDGKRQEILMEAVPGLRRMAALSDADTTPPRQIEALQEAARACEVELRSIGPLGPRDHARNRCIEELGGRGVQRAGVAAPLRQSAPHH
jgi:putative tryptophan/tyrosine transport system substrate-binding protein